MHQTSYEYYQNKKDYGVNNLRRAKINSLAKDELAGGHKKILDLGCAGGYLSANWKVNGNIIVGADISEPSVRAASAALDRAYQFDLESLAWPAEIDCQKFDLILLAEVIEHLFNPADFLMKLKNLLALNGSIILTSPNFLVWNNRLRLLFGNYGPKEIFNDPSHIHLFGYLSLKKLITELNYQIVAEDNLWYPNYLEKLKKFLPANLFVYQTILRIKNKKL